MAKLNDNAMDLLRKRYFQEGEKQWSDLASRVSLAIADAEETEDLKDKYAKEFYEMINNLEFVPSTPCLINANIHNRGQLSSCFTIDLRDNIESIYQAKSECAKIFQKNGGVGFNISVLRSEGDAVETSKGYSCGTIGFMEEFDLTADVVTRNNIRKGAIKIDLNDWHPDIHKFIRCKDDTSKLQRMNISVSVSDKFMRAVENDEDWHLIFPDYSWDKEVYNQEWDGNIDKWINKGYPIKTYETIKARELYNEIMKHAWKTGEPGISFRDRMDKDNPNPHLGIVDRSNPCQEFTSIPYNSCNLGSINLVKCFNDGIFSYPKLESLTRNATRFLDNMITVNKLPLEKIENITKGVRSIGLGVMGFADLCYLMGIKYNSKEGYDFADNLFDFISRVSKDESIKLGEEKGVYPLWQGSLWEKNGIKTRNSNNLSIAPTGSISFIAGVSSGIEPLFGIVFTRRTNEGDIYYVVNPIFKQELQKRGLYSEKILQKISDNHGSCQGISEIPQDIQDVFVTAHDITPNEHAKMVSIIQKHVDLSISKTVNLLNDATVEDIKDVYMYSWKHDIKGITIYRDGSRDNQTLATKREEIKTEPQQIQRGEWKDVAEDTEYYRRKIYIGCGKLNLFIGYSQNEKSIQDLYVVRSGNGGCERNLQAMVIAMSGMLRLGGNIFNIEKAFEGVGGCPSFASQRAKGEKLNQGNSCGIAILYEIKKFLKEIEISESIPYLITANKEVDTPSKPQSKNVCPECGEELQLVEGCISCRSCGFSKCN